MKWPIDGHIISYLFLLRSGGIQGGASSPGVGATLTEKNIAHITAAVQAFTWREGTQRFKRRSLSWRCVAAREIFSFASYSGGFLWLHWAVIKPAANMTIKTTNAYVIILSRWEIRILLSSPQNIPRKHNAKRRRSISIALATYKKLNVHISLNMKIRRLSLCSLLVSLFFIMISP